MAKLTKYEKETIILFNEGEDTASIYTFNAGLKKRLALFAKKYPDLCRQEKTYDQGGVSYVLDKSRLSSLLFLLSPSTKYSPDSSVTGLDAIPGLLITGKSLPSL